MYGFHLMAEGDYACFTRPEFKVERASYDVPTPGAVEGLLKSVYWKPAIRYVVDKIVVFNPIDFVNIRRNEVKDNLSYTSVKSNMNGAGKDIAIYASESRNQRAAMVLKNVKYGFSVHFELTGLRNDREEDGAEAKHYCILKRRLENGQYFRPPCFGCAEFPVKRLTFVDELPLGDVHPDIASQEDVDLGYMLYRLRFADGGVPVNGDWNDPKYSDKADALYYRPHMKKGVIDVRAYAEVIKC